jgi:hypothetical protein
MTCCSRGQHHLGISNRLSNEKVCAPATEYQQTSGVGGNQLCVCGQTAAANFEIVYCSGPAHIHCSSLEVGNVLDVLFLSEGLIHL